MGKRKPLKKITENDVKRAIKKMLDTLGIWNFHILQGLGAYKGIPDRFAVYQGVVYAIEVKSPTGKLSDKQKTFRDLWNEAYRPTYIVAKSAEDVINGMKLNRKVV